MSADDLVRHYQHRMEFYRINALLNASEKASRKRIGKKRTKALQLMFKAEAGLDPSAYADLYAQPDPYRWLAEEWVPRHRA